MNQRPTVTTFIAVVCLSLVSSEAVRPPSPTPPPLSPSRCSILAREIMSWPIGVRLTLANVPDSLPVPAALDEPAVVPSCTMGTDPATTLGRS